MIKRNKGSTIITAPLVIALGIMIVATLIVFSVNILSPYIWYEKLSSTCIKYTFVMEEYGYLTNLEKNNLLRELKNQGFDTEYITINCTTRRQSYGNPIHLRINYAYKLVLPIVGEKYIPMVINRESVSKR